MFPLFSTPLLSSNSMTPIVLITEKINSGFHLTFPNSYPNLHMYLISNFITCIPTTLPSSRLKFFYILPPSLVSDTTPPYSMSLSLQKTIFSSSANTQLLHLQLKFSLYSQAIHVPLEVILMRIPAALTAFLYCSFWCIIIE